MTKIEKYFKDEITPNEAYDLLFEFVGYISLLPMNNQDDRINVYNKVMEFLNQSVKPIISEDEKVILRNICFQPIKDFYITRIHGTLRLHNRLDELYDFFAYDHLFQFIKERRRI